MVPLNRGSLKTPPCKQKLRLYLAYNRSYDSLIFFKFPSSRHYKFFGFFRVYQLNFEILKWALPCA